MHKNTRYPYHNNIRITHFVIFITTIVFFSCKRGDVVTEPQISRIEGKEININDSITEDKTIDEFVKPFRKHIDEDLSAPLAYNPSDLSKTDGELNTAIGNLMADIVMEKSQPVFKKRTGKNIDAVLLNFGGIRATMSKGQVTARTAYEVMPFENAIVVLELTADKIQKLITYLAKAKTAHPVNGLQLTLDKDGKVKKFLIAGKPLDKSRHYYIATSDYLMNGGDNMNFFLDPVNTTPLDYRIRNAMIDYFTETDTIRTQQDNRFIRK
ncbi:5'-nucleotidase C-terminal domain-containing protein [Sinomicrobium sp. M5D2P17]